MTQYIAERRLLYSLKGSDIRNEFVIRLGAPYLVKEGMVAFTVGPEGCSGCHIEFQGISETYKDVYGVDSIQAVSIASNAIEPILERLQKKYDIYWLSGDPYFDN